MFKRSISVENIKATLKRLKIFFKTNENVDENKKYACVCKSKIRKEPEMVIKYKWCEKLKW